MHKRVSRVLVPVLGILVLVAGGGAAQGGQISQGAKALKTLRIVRNTYKSDAGFTEMALHKGYYKEEGIDLQPQYVDNVESSVRALLSGYVDIYEQDPGSVLDSIVKGARDLRIIGITLSGVSYYLYAKKDIKTARDLEGRSSGMASPKGFLDSLITMYMIKHGADPSKLERARTGGSSTSFKALLAGKIDSSVAPPQWKPYAEKDPNLHVVASMGKELPEFISKALVVREKLLKERPDDVRAFLRATLRGIRYAVTHRDETIALTAELLKQPKTDEGIVLTTDMIIQDRLATPDLMITPEQIDYMFNTRVIMGNIKQDQVVPAKGIVDTALAQQMARDLGPFQWP